MNIVDSLVLEFDLDPKKFTENQRKVIEGIRDTEDAVTQHGKKIEGASESISKSFNSVTKSLIGMAGAYLGTSAISGFIQNTTQANLSVGQLGVTLGLTTEKISQYKQAARLANVNPEAIVGSIQGITGNLNAVAAGQAGSGFWEAYAKLGVKGNVLGPDGKPVSQEEFLLRVQEAVRRTQANGSYSQSQITGFLQQLGINSDTAYVLERTDNSLEKFLETSKKIGVQTKEQFEDATKVDSAWAELKTSAENLGRALYHDLAPGLEKVLQWLKGISDWFQEHRKVFDVLAGALSGAAVGAGIGSIVPGVGTGLGAVAGGVAGAYTGYTLRNRPPGEAGAAGAPGNASLAERRAFVGREMAADAGLRDELAGMMVLEGASDPVPVMESLANRAEYVNAERAKRGLEPLTLRQMLHSGFYGPINRGQLPGAVRRIQTDQALRDRMYRAIDEVTGGSNTIRGATDQGLPTDPNGRWPGGRVYRGGNVFNDWGGGPGGHEGARLFREEQQRGVGATSPWLGGRAAPVPYLPQFPNAGTLHNQSNVTNDRRSSINFGDVSIQTASQSARGIAGEFMDHVENRFRTVQATTGLV